MPKFDQDAKNQTFELLNGDFPFEVLKVENKISQGQKTAGSDTREITLVFYRDESFKEQIAKFTDTLIDHDSCSWKYSLFAKCVGFPVQHGEAFDVTPEWVGYRGWAHCAPEASRSDATKKFNRVRVYLTDRKPIERVKPSPIDADDVPF